MKIVRCFPTIRTLAGTAVIVWLLLAEVATSALVARDAATTTVRTEHGLHAVSFNTLQGKVRVLLPDDMAAGDTISGTVTIEPAGSTDAERVTNTGVLRGTVIEMGGEKNGAATPTFTLRVPEAAKQSIPIVFSIAGTAASRQRVTTNVPVASPAAVQNLSSRIAEMPGRFDWQPTVSQGNPATITGPFDGQSSTTQLSVGGVKANTLAESPRQAVFQIPSGAAPGPTTLELTEKDTTVNGQVRSVQVQLSAPRTDLRSGERTEVTIEVRGLQELKQPLPLEVRTGGNVKTEGGNLQRFDIPPGDPRIAAGGVFRTGRTLTALSAGAFEVTAEIIWAHPAYHWLNNRTVHVEGEPGGQPGRWRIPVAFPRDTAKHGVYFGGEKPPNLHPCDWIEIKSAEERDGIDYVTDYGRTTDPTKPKPEPKVAGKTVDTKPVTPPPAGPGAAGGGKTDTTEPPPCKPGDTRVVSSEEKKFTLLDGKAERFLHVYSDKSGAIIAAEEFADYLKTIADKGGKVSEHLPEGDGAGGATVDFLLKYLEHGGAIMKAVAGGKIGLAGATKFTAAMDVGLRDVIATCTTLQVCRNGVWVTEKKFTQTETKRRETFTKTASIGDEEWDIITKKTKSIDPEAAAKWADDFFIQQANILKGNYDELQKFKDSCK